MGPRTRGSTSVRSDSRNPSRRGAVTLPFRALAPMARSRTSPASSPVISVRAADDTTDTVPPGRPRRDRARAHPDRRPSPPGGARPLSPAASVVRRKRSLRARQGRIRGNYSGISPPVRRRTGRRRRRRRRPRRAAVGSTPPPSVVLRAGGGGVLGNFESLRDAYNCYLLFIYVRVRK